MDEKIQKLLSLSNINNSKFVGRIRRMGRLKIGLTGQQISQSFQSLSFTPARTLVCVFYDTVRVPHSCLISWEEPSSTKTISCSTLVEKQENQRSLEGRMSA